jgi:hypothetical protein
MLERRTATVTMSAPEASITRLVCVLEFPGSDDQADFCPIKR